MIWVFLDLSLDREAILNSPSRSARIELEQRVGPNVLRKFGGIIITVLLTSHQIGWNLSAGHDQSTFASTLKHSQAYPNRSCDYDYDWMYVHGKIGVNYFPFYFFLH